MCGPFSEWRYLFYNIFDSNGLEHIAHIDLLDNEETWFTVWLHWTGILWCFVYLDKFVPGRYFQINKFSGLLNRPLVRTWKSVPTLFVRTSKISVLVMNHHLFSSPYLFQKGVTCLTTYLMALDWNMLFSSPYLFQKGVTCLTTYLMALDWNMLFSSPYLFENGVTCLTTYLMALDWNMLFSSPYLFENGVTCLTTYLMALDWNMLLSSTCLWSADCFRACFSRSSITSFTISVRDDASSSAGCRISQISILIYGYAPEFFSTAVKKWWRKLNRIMTSSALFQNGTYIWILVSIKRQF